MGWQISFFGNPARHSDFHTEEGVPRLKIAVGDVIARPGYKRAGVPNRLAAVHFGSAFFAENNWGKFAQFAAVVPPRREIRGNAEFISRS